MLPATGNGLRKFNYTYQHNTPFDGNNYYRLKMIGNDGLFTYSPLIKINIAVPKTVILAFPNPAKDKLYIHGLTKYGRVEIASVDGKIIHRQNISPVMQYLNVRALAPGVYVLTLTGETDWQMLKFIKN